MKIHTKYSKGFTLLETLASIAIISFVVIGPLAAIVNSSSYARKTKDTMTANYLAEEAIELLQNQYDSLFVYCRKNPESVTCTTTTGESPNQVAWRVFKERMSDTINGVPTGVPSCYAPNTCAFDSINMTGDITAVPSRYNAVSSECSSVVEVATPMEIQVPIDVVVPGGANGSGVTQTQTITKVINRHTYMCQGLTDITRLPLNATTSTKTFNRSVTIEQLSNPSEVGLPVNQQYHDDLRIVTTVDFKAFNGRTGSVSITRFMHARQ